MLVVEQLVSPHAHSHSHHSDLALQAVKGDSTSNVEFDAELGNLEREEGLERQADSTSAPDTSARAFALTLGLVIHGLTDGLALGVASVGGGASKLSMIVFLALIIHKGELTVRTIHTGL